MKHSKGFTLLELSIVIVIIGLIVAGISAGQSLVRQASLRALATEIQDIRLNVRTFKMQYNKFPGDINNASSYWPGATNGNGDNLITTSGELTNVWAHMNSSGIWNRNYNSSTLYSNALSNAWYRAYSYGASHPLASVLNLGNNVNDPSGGQNCGPILTTTEAYALDVKIDDGYARIGNLWACFNSCHSSNTAYRLNVSGLQCAFHIQYLNYN